MHGQTSRWRATKPSKIIVTGLNRPEALCECGRSMLKSVDQVLGMEFQLLQAYFFELLIRRQIRLLKQFFQPLSVATMFGVETTYFFAQRGVIYLVHQSTSLILNPIFIVLPARNRQAGRLKKMTRAVEFLTIAQEG
jgi:hypothetical protein